MSLEDRAAQTIHNKFDELPKKCKPRSASESGVAEWVPLSGIVLCYKEDEVQCVALGTGMKCLPHSKLPTANGNILHDWHAEVVAMRAFNHFLLTECFTLSSDSSAESKVIMRRDRSDIEPNNTNQPYTLRPSIRILMYCSEAPCGDASMELVMQKQEDATPWSPISPSSEGELLGRGRFSELGVVRRKPSRGDSPPTMSKSCSDKIALKQCTSLLSGLTARLISPENAYIDTLILPASQYVEEACDRCFGAEGRISMLRGRTWPGGYSFRPFRIVGTEEAFSFSQAEVSKLKMTACKGSNVSAVWTEDGVCETLTNGVLQGRKQDDPRGASWLSRRRMFELVVNAGVAVAQPSDSLHPHASYRQVKTAGAVAVARSQVKVDVIKDALSGWVANNEDDFHLL